MPCKLGALLIGDKVPDNDKHWENFLQLHEIVDYVFAPTTTNAIIDYLTVLIEDYLVDVKTLSPDRRLTPKNALFNTCSLMDESNLTVRCFNH